MNKREQALRSTVLIGSAFLVTLLVSGVAVGVHLNRSPQEIPEEGVLVRVQRGAGVGQIASSLQSAGLIRSAGFFKLLSYWKGPRGSLKTGHYRVVPDMTTIDVYTMIQEGREELVKVTLKEGMTVTETAVHLAEREITSQEDFLRMVRSRQVAQRYGVAGETLEGFLFPETYFFARESRAEDVVERLVQTFFENLRVIYPEAETLAQEALYAKIVLASIVEKEGRVASEAPVIASVFYNRLAIGMFLQTGVTVIYAMTEERGAPRPRRIYERDLEIESLYNTYRHEGLPPGPICSPGSVALRAAFYPATTDYLFFVVEDLKKGTHTFSRDMAAHERGRAAYIKLMNQLKIWK